MKTERIPCPKCGMPVELPANEDTQPEETLCNKCYEDSESTA